MKQIQNKKIIKILIIKIVNKYISFSIKNYVKFFQYYLIEFYFMFNMIKFQNNQK